nr:predicted GPI-anchored protein 58 [Meriones unguiculatus]
MKLEWSLYPEVYPETTTSYVVLRRFVQPKSGVKVHTFNPETWDAKARKPQSPAFLAVSGRVSRYRPAPSDRSRRSPPAPASLTGGDRSPAARAPERARQAGAVGSERASPASPHPTARGIQQEPAAPRPRAAKQTKGGVASSGDDRPLSLEKLPCSSPRWPRAALHRALLPDARQGAALSFPAAPGSQRAHPGAADSPGPGWLT